MVTGRIKSFNKERGYGFVVQDDGPDIFIRYTALQMEGSKVLEKGQRLEFEMENTQRASGENRLEVLSSNSKAHSF